MQGFSEGTSEGTAAGRRRRGGGAGLSRRAAGARAAALSRSACSTRVRHHAISEVSLRDVCMMAFDEINAKGG